jgi:large subunit ribosomal protein L2
MALKTFNPTTPSQRQLVIVDRSGLYKGKPVKALTEGKSDQGRPQQPRPHHRPASSAAVTSAPTASSTSSAASFDMRATVERLEYDPNRTAFIALIKYADGELAYILAPQRLAVGDKVIAGRRRREAGQRHAAAVHPGRHDRPQRRAEAGQGRPDRPFAGTYAQLVGRDQGYVILRLNSGEQRLVHGPACHDRRGVEPGPHEHQRSARPAASAGSASARTTAVSP